MMKENFKILTEFIKDMSSETPDVQSYLFVKDNISKYHLTININSNPLKNKLIEINTCFKFEDKENNEKKSLFEIVYVSVVKINDAIMNNEKELQKIILCDIQNKIYPNIEKAFQNLLTDSGFPDVKFQKKVDFNKLYNEQFT